MSEYWYNWNVKKMSNSGWNYTNFELKIIPSHCSAGKKYFILSLSCWDNKYRVKNSPYLCGVGIGCFRILINSHTRQHYICLSIGLITFQVSGHIGRGRNKKSSLVLCQKSLLFILWKVLFYRSVLLVAHLRHNWANSLLFPQVGDRTVSLFDPM